MPDRIFPALHIRPAKGWVNDPNGVCLIDGTYHVFFQHNPDAPWHGNVHWGHVSSTDLLRWAHHPPALVPRPGMIDAAGCWSGCVTDDAGIPTAIYTANPDDARRAVVALARSDRSLLNWRQDDAAVVVTPIRPGLDEVRDPFVFRYDGRRYAVQGAGHRHGHPQLLVWACDDLTQWLELGALFNDDDPIAAQMTTANIWECPNVVRIDDQWVLLLSLWAWVNDTHRLIGVRYLLGNLVAERDSLRFEARATGVVDEGPAFYAPQVMPTTDRTLLWGWAWEIGRTPEQIIAAGWAGMLTFPRELFVRDGRLCSRPAAELTGLRSAELPRQEAITEHAFEIVTDGPATLRLIDGDAEQAIVAVTGSAAAPARIFVDGSIIEAFSGGAAHTTRAYPSASSRWSIEAGGSAVRVYRLAVDQD
ncbi:MAG TPA: glycoside hydrolase family 32 protein [Propionibacteriaceae bacterium]|nr:glycoside hydrolase family 32 protein [Propionibacteriaceae bacterium]